MSTPWSASDPKARLITLFLGAVLLPSVALSALSRDLVPKLAKATKLGMIKQAERSLWYIDQDLGRTARARALEAARAVGTDRLLDGRPEMIRAALGEAGLPLEMFDSLRLEVSSKIL